VTRQGEPVLHDISLEIQQGDILMVIGPSGSGKSTLLRTINRLLEVPPGSIFLQGEDITKIDVLSLRRRVGMVFQSPVLFPGTVAKNLRFGSDLRQRPLSDAQVEQLLRDVGLPDGFATKDTSKLSGGEAQRVALARTLAVEPEVLLLDEPTSALDPQSTRQVEATLCQLNAARGLTLIWVSHLIEQTRRVGQQVLYLKDGRVADYGTVNHVLNPEGHHDGALSFAQGIPDKEENAE
jgi:ABC-type methionine transport system ATPase subunit